jgi:triosephosphate isomerase
MTVFFVYRENGEKMTDPNKAAIIIGNWKMYHTVDSSLSFLKTFALLVLNVSSKVYLAVPFTSIAPMVEEAKNSNIVIGAQNMHDATEGAFTGEIAAQMLKDAGAKFVILGHSERRRIFNEDNAFINRKVKSALSDGLQAVLCIGETQQQREEGQTQQVLDTQITECLADVKAEQMANVIIAYEPIWAIGTHQPATPEIAEEAHKHVREVIAKIFNYEIAKNSSILYGGSVKPNNAANFLEQQDVDGLLVGGASLNPETFFQIVDCQKNNLIVDKE